MQVEFKFNIGEVVVVKQSGEQGFVTMLAVDHCGSKVAYILTGEAHTSRWYSLDMLHS